MELTEVDKKIAALHEEIGAKNQDLQTLILHANIDLWQCYPIGKWARKDSSNTVNTHAKMRPRMRDDDHTHARVRIRKDQTHDDPFEHAPVQSVHALGAVELDSHDPTATFSNPLLVDDMLEFHALDGLPIIPL